MVVPRTDGDLAVQHATQLVAGRCYVIAADRDVIDKVLRGFRGD